MENNNLTFEKLPAAVNELTSKIDRIEKLLLSKSYDDNDDNLLTIDQAAKFLNLAKQSVYGKVSRNEIPVYKPAGTKRLYFSKADLLQYLQSGRQKTKSEINDDAGSCLLRNRR